MGGGLGCMYEKVGVWQGWGVMAHGWRVSLYVWEGGGNGRGGG